MTKSIVLGIKGSSSSGNRMHAGRPGLVGGSRPRNYGAALAAWNGSPTLQNLMPQSQLDNLNRVGLQAVIDHSQGVYNSSTAFLAVINDPNSQRGATPVAAPAVATAATPPVTPAAPPAPVTPPATGQTPVNAQLQTDAMTTFQSWPYKYRRQFPVDMNSLNDKGLQAVLDMQAKKITPAQMYAIVQDPSSHKTGVVTPPPWKTAAQPAAAPTTPIPVSPKPAAPAAPPAVSVTDAQAREARDALTALHQDPSSAFWAKNVDPAKLTPEQIKAIGEYNKGLRTHDELKAMLGQGAVKDPRFYQGKIDEKTSAEAIFKGSSPEMQAIALKTGVLPTDQATLDYVNSMSARLGKQPHYIKDYQTNVNQGAAQNLHDQFYNWENGAKTHNDFGNPFNSARQITDSTGGVAAMSRQQLAPHELAVVNKMSSVHHDAEVAYDRAYKAANTGSVYMSYSARANAARDASNAVLQAAWSSMSPAEQKLARELNVRYGTADWIHSNVPQTFFQGSRRVMPPTYKAPGVGDIKYSQGIDVMREGFDYRNQFLQRKTPLPTTTGYKANEVLALSKLDPTKEQAVKDQFNNTWDKVQHSSFSGTPRNAFQVHPQQHVLDTFETFKARDNVADNLYHGTHYEAGQSIAANGYKVFPSSQAKAGRAMGDGIYLADKSSKSAQYLHGGGFSRGQGSGVMFVNRTYKGQQADVSSGSGYYGYGSSSVNTVFGGVPYWRNNEWAVKDAGAVLPHIWIDVALK